MDLVAAEQRAARAQRRAPRVRRVRSSLDPKWVEQRLIRSDPADEA